jgi:hypothetical protein
MRSLLWPSWQLLVGLHVGRQPACLPPSRALDAMSSSTTTTTITHPDGTTVQITTATTAAEEGGEGGEWATLPASDNGLLSFEFDVKGQKGKIPQVGLGTATLFDQKCTGAVRTAIQAGYRHIDTAYLYNNQKAVGEGPSAAAVAG